MCVCVHRRRFYFSSFLMKNVVAVVWPLIGAGESCGASEMLDIFLGEEEKKIRGVDVSKRNDFCRVFERW